MGCGSVGTECAKRFGAFGCLVLGVDLNVRQDEHFQNIVALERMDEFLHQSDVVVLTLPLTDQTRHMFDAGRFAAMKQGGVLVNIARGAVVDTCALLSALDDKLGGAVLDVFEEEPLNPSHPLWDMQSVILTPHNSFISRGNDHRLRDVIFSNLANE